MNLLLLKSFWWNCRPSGPGADSCRHAPRSGISMCSVLAAQSGAGNREQSALCGQPTSTASTAECCWQGGAECRGWGVCCCSPVGSCVSRGKGVTFLALVLLTCICLLMNIFLLVRCTPSLVQSAIGVSTCCKPGLTVFPSWELVGLSGFSAQYFQWLCPSDVLCV